MHQLIKNKTILITYAAVLFLCAPCVHSLAATDGNFIVVFFATDQEQISKDNLECLCYDNRNGTDPNTFLDGKTDVIHTTDSKSMSALVDQCVKTQGDLPEKYHRSKRNLLNLLKGIYPGTKWCGMGNVANHPNDLGKFQKADKCCRDHDTTCERFILSKEIKYGVYNPEIYSISDCNCDTKFRECLQSAGTLTAMAVGDLFFNVIKVKCLQVTPTFQGNTQVGLVGKFVEPEHYHHSSIVEKVFMGAIVLGIKILKFFY